MGKSSAGLRKNRPHDVPILDSETVPRESRLRALPKPSPQTSPTPPHAPAQACNGDLRASARVLPLIPLRPVRGRCEVPGLPSERNSFPTEHKKNDEAKQDCRPPHDHLHADHSRHQHPDHARPPSPLPEPARLHRHPRARRRLLFLDRTVLREAGENRAQGLRHDPFRRISRLRLFAVLDVPESAVHDARLFLVDFGPFAHERPLFAGDLLRRKDHREKIGRNPARHSGRLHSGRTSRLRNGFAGKRQFCSPCSPCPPLPPTSSSAATSAGSTARPLR